LFALSIAGPNPADFQNFVTPPERPERFNRGFDHICVIA
jgi:hypothetical protein